MLAQATRQLQEAIGHLGARSELASDAANAAVKSDRRVEHIYRGAMCAARGRRPAGGDRALYRRIQYAVVKES